MKKHTNRKPMFRFVKSILRIFVRKPKLIVLGAPPQNAAVYLCNHVGAKGPLNLELYFPKMFRFWGTYEMNATIRERFKYLSKIYFHQKKHINLFLSYIIAGIAIIPMTLFYKGMQLISTYKDSRLRKSIKTSFEEIKKDHNIIIFPENSTNGYFDQLVEYHAGFVVLAKYCFEKGMDLPIYNMYFKTKPKQLIIDNPIHYSEIRHLDKKEVAQIFLERANQLGQNTYS